MRTTKMISERVARKIVHNYLDLKKELDREPTVEELKRYMPFKYLVYIEDKGKYKVYMSHEIALMPPSVWWELSKFKSNKSVRNIYHTDMDIILRYVYSRGDNITIKRVGKYFYDTFNNID